MSRLFADTTDKELEENLSTFGGCLSLAFILLIPIAGFFWFVWEPLGKGLLFVAIFTCIWTSAFVLFTDKEIKLRDKESKE
jgi:hypothetical protein